MNLSALYKKVLIFHPIDQPKFIALFNDTQLELCNLYHSKYALLPDTSFIDATSTSDGTNVRDEYASAILHEILFFATGEPNYHERFLETAQYAYKNVWKQLSSGKRIYPKIWR